MSDRTLTRETLAEATSRKPVEGHTPGPWEAGPIHKTYRHHVFTEKRTGVLCETLLFRHDEDHANADLIAAAPDLQAENQVLQAAVRQVNKALDLVMADEYAWNELCDEAQEAVVEVQSLLPTEGDSNG